MDPFEADIANSGVCEQDAKPPGRFGWFFDKTGKGLYHPGKGGLAVGASPFGEVPIRETSKQQRFGLLEKVDDESAIKATKVITEGSSQNDT